MTNIDQILTTSDKHTLFSKGACLNTKQKVPAASLKRRKHGLGLPIHIKYKLILLNIAYYIILVLNRLLYQLYWISYKNTCLFVVEYAYFVNGPAKCSELWHRALSQLLASFWKFWVKLHVATVKGPTARWEKSRILRGKSRILRGNSI